MKMPGRMLYALAALVCMGAMTVPAASDTFSFQGRLIEAGTPVAGPLDLTFKMFDANLGGVQVGGDLDFAGFDDFDGGGHFTVELDFGAGTFDGDARWLEIWVDGVVLNPRQEIASMPYAHYAMNAATVVDGGLPTTYAGAVDFSNAGNSFSGSGAGLTGLDASNMSSGTIHSDRMAGFYANEMAFLSSDNVYFGSYFGDGSNISDLQWSNLDNVPAGFADGVDNDSSLWNISGTDLHYIAGNVGVGTATPTAQLHVESSSSDAALRVFNFNPNEESAAVSGWSLGGLVATYGVYGRSDSNIGSGVYGYASSGSGTNHGVYGQSESPIGYGVYGYSTNGSGGAVGVHGLVDSSHGKGVSGVAASVVGPTMGVYGESNSTDGFGVVGYATSATGVNHGLYGESISVSGRAVAAHASASTGTTYGVHARSASTSGRALFGHAQATTGTNFGVYAQSSSISGRGVFGHAMATGGNTYGVYAQNDSSAGRAVYGIATASSGTTYGVSGVSNSTDGRAVHGHATATSGTTYGMYAQNDSTSGRGVYGNATANSGTNYGIYGNSNSGSGYGVYSNGDMGASGTKSFVIDHPLDPENKYLKHYCAEGPEPKNIYDGVVTLDSMGEAWIDLPDYFEAINRDPRYTLTPIGAAMPNLHVAEKVQGNTFRIAGGVAFMEVSWEVKAVRNDAYVRHRGAPVEVDKPEEQRGLYQFPEHYGQPAEKGIHFEHSSAAYEVDE